MPQTDTYIEKDSSVNEEIERLRHSATAALLSRNDVIIVASVSAIYGLGSPDEYEGQLLRVYRGTEILWNSPCSGWSTSSTSAIRSVARAARSA